ncbi:hypothetical protein [Streptomyces sp. NPDC015125]|uniref:hypothetical protein n=1 Tax=Streptomyces sp. NPDC015125 TaxID=3364938 RepID=UPI0036FA1160
MRTFTLADHPGSLALPDQSTTVVARAQNARPRLSTAHLTPISVLDDAEKRARTAARALLPLVAATVHAQFPAGAYLVLTRSADDELNLDSVRTAQGVILWESTRERFRNSVPAEIAALWGDSDAQKPGTVLDLVQRIDGLSSYDFLPAHAMHEEEETAERTPLGIPLDPAAVCPERGTAREWDDHVQPSTPHGERI